MRSIPKLARDLTACCAVNYRSRMEIEGADELLSEDRKKKIKQRNHPGPLPRLIYELFVRSLRRRASQPDLSPWPSGPELKAAGFLKPKGGHSRREKFKSWAGRMEIVTDQDTAVQMLRHKRTGKIIVPIEEFENVIRRTHRQAEHDARKTSKMIQDKYTIGNREFGIDKQIIKYVIDTCPECVTKCRFQDYENQNGSEFPHLNGISPTNHNLTPVTSIHSCSMVANVPDTRCIWFDKGVIASNPDLYSRLRALLNEVRGELGWTSRGNKAARERLLIKIYIAESLIREYKTTLPPDSLSITEYNEQFIADVKTLLENYRSQGREDQFLPDMRLLVDAYRSAGYSDLFIQSFEALTRSLLANGR